MTAPTPTPPCLGEREAVARALGAPHCWVIPGQDTANDYGAIDAHCIEHGEMSRPLWPIENIMAAVAPLRTENETLRAEWDAAIARAEEAERKIQLYRQIAPERIAEMVEEYGAYNATCKLGKVYGTATIGEFVSALLATAKLAQAEGEIATMRAKAEEQVAYWRTRQAAEKCLEEGISEDGETYTPIGDEAAWQSGYCNGRMSEADWWRSTFKYELPALTTPEHPHGD